MKCEMLIWLTMRPILRDSRLKPVPPWWSASGRWPCVITHGHLPEADHHGGTGFRRLSRKIGRIVSQINISHFIYKPGDLSTSTGIPRVRANRRLLFYNGDSDQSIWHTITT